MASVEAPSRSKATPLPLLQMTIISVCLLSESICATMLIPFVGLFVAFMQGWKAEEAGYASGFLIGLFMLGQVISCKAWSLLSDRYGRKIGVVLGISGSALATLLFGLSSNIWICSFWRFIHGLFTGSSLISKTVIADVTDKTNEAKGFMLISLTWGIGLLFGPAIGGFLYDPAHSSFGQAIGVSETGFMSRYPAFLPSLFTSIYNVVASAIAIIFLEESNPQAKPMISGLPTVVREKIGWLFEYLQPKIPTATTEVTIVDLPRASKSSPVGGTSEASPSQSSTVHRTFGFKQAFQLHLTRDVLVVSMLISASDMIYAETFPLWGIAEVKSGGLGLKADSIGVLILVNSIPGIGANVVFPSVLKWYNDELKFFRQTEIAYAVLSFLIAFAPYFGSSGGFWFAMLIGLIRKGWESWCWSVLMMVCAQTAPRGKVGVMYAVQQASACVVRCIVPFIGAPLFAWSIIGNHIFPFNHFLLFVLSAIPLLFSYALTYRVFLPAEYEYGEDPVPFSDENRRSGEQAPVGFSSRSFLGSDGDSRNGDEDEPEGLMNSSFSTLATSFAMAMGPGNLQPSVMIGNLTGEDKRQDEEEQDPVETSRE